MFPNVGYQVRVARRTDKKFKTSEKMETPEAAKAKAIELYNAQNRDLGVSK